MDVRSLKDEAAELFRKGRFAKAAERYDALSKAEPKDAQHLIKLGDSLRRDGKREHAITAYCKAVDMYAQQGVVIKAIAACKLVLEIDPEQKAVQEALANLCARRYVRREPLETPPPPPPRPAPKAGRYEAIDLPDEESSAPPIETAGGEILEIDDATGIDFDDGESLELDPPVAPAATHRAPPIRPPPPPPPRREDTPAPIELIELDMGEPPAVSAPPEPDAIELDLGAPPVVAAVPEPDSIELDLDVPVASPPEEIEEVIELVPIEEPVATTTSERRVLREADVAARQPVTAMVDILSDSLLIEGEVEDGEEIELLSITTGEQGLVSAAELSQPEEEEEEVELVALPETAPAPSPPPAASEALARERQEMQRLVNEAAFDVTPPPAVEEAPAAEEVDLEPPSERTPGAEVSQHDVPLFSELPHDAFIDLLEKVAFRRLEEGEVILREGDAGRSIFVLASGRARVVKHHGTSNPIELAVLEDGAFFGEMALLTGAARVASVVADEDCEVLELTEELLRDLTAKHPSVAHSLKKFYRQRLLSNVMAISPLFRAFDKSDRKMLVEKFKLREMKPGEPVIREGDRPDGLYVVMHGVCLVSRTAPDGSRQVPLAVLREGDVFGEMSLLSRQPASATVTAKRRTLVLRLPKAVFDELMFTHPAVLEVVSELTDQRTRVNEDILSGRLQVSDEVLALV